MLGNVADAGLTLSIIIVTTPASLLFLHERNMGDQQLTKVIAVGGNSVSAFLSWRLSATNACDVTLVWKNGFESVAQYGLSFK